ncbi:MAG: hypothetical protein ACI4TZ_01605 [Christensenellales bacterium]
MDLRCNKTNCKHNKCYCCTATEVHIAKNTDCRTYDKDPEKTPDKLQDVSRDMFEVAPEIAGYKHDNKMNVKCNAKCLFNKNGLCNANGITVLEHKKDGICGTFIEE